MIEISREKPESEKDRSSAISSGLGILILGESLLTSGTISIHSLGIEIKEEKGEE